MPFVEDLTLDTGYRFSNYSTAGTTNTYKFEVQYAPVKDARLRASFDRAVRAPNLIELFNPQSYGQQSFVGTDPCVPTPATASAPAAGPTATLQQCLRTGMTAAQYNAMDVGLQCTGNQCGQVCFRDCASRVQDSHGPCDLSQADASCGAEGAAIRYDLG